MSSWSNEDLEKVIYNWNGFSKEEQAEIANFMKFSTPEAIEEEILFTKSAVERMVSSKDLLSNGGQFFPETINGEELKGDFNHLKCCAIVITAGGEGERLRISLEEAGYSKNQLEDFTKATFPIPGLEDGCLQLNLKLISKIEKEIETTIPVIVTTGPEGSSTADIIPRIIKNNSNFGLKQLEIISQNERFHLTKDHKIVFQKTNNSLTPVTNPDETGGPLMKLKDSSGGESTLEKLASQGYKKLIVLQGTALYDPQLLAKIATAAKDYDGLGIGIGRSEFPENDPYGTFVMVDTPSEKGLRIVEKDVRTEATYKLKDSLGSCLPYNTGFYAFDIELLNKNSLPPYASPDKEILPNLKAPKTGFAATDTLSNAKQSGVLLLSPNSFVVLKNREDLPALAKTAEKFNLA